MIVTALHAGLWGLFAAVGLLIGAATAWFIELPHRAIAAITGFGGGVLIAVVSVDLMQMAFDRGGLGITVVGFLTGAAVFCTINWRLARHGAKHRKRCGGCVKQPTENQHKGSGLAIATGALLDGVPESLVIGLTLMAGGQIGLSLVAGFFLANIPQGLSSAAGMKQAGRSPGYVFGVWGTIVVASGVAAAIGGGAGAMVDPTVYAGILAFAAGGVLAMLAETMIPEAFDDAQSYIGLVTVAGFLTAFLLIKAD